MYDHIRSYMIIQDHIWFYMILYDHIWWYMVIHDFVWWYIIMYDNVIYLYITLKLNLLNSLAAWDRCNKLKSSMSYAQHYKWGRVGPKSGRGPGTGPVHEQIPPSYDPPFASWPTAGWLAGLRWCDDNGITEPGCSPHSKWNCKLAGASLRLDLQIMMYRHDS